MYPPAAQNWQIDTPNAENEPEEQETHAALDAAPKDVEKVPGRHCKQKFEDGMAVTEEYVPTWQFWQTRDAVAP